MGQYTEGSYFGARHDPQLFIPQLLNALWRNPSQVCRTPKQLSSRCLVSHGRGIFCGSKPHCALAQN